MHRWRWHAAAHPLLTFNLLAGGHRSFVADLHFARYVRYARHLGGLHGQQVLCQLCVVRVQADGLLVIQ